MKTLFAIAFVAATVPSFARAASVVTYEWTGEVSSTDPDYVAEFGVGTLPYELLFRVPVAGVDALPANPTLDSFDVSSYRLTIGGRVLDVTTPITARVLFTNDNPVGTDRATFVATVPLSPAPLDNFGFTTSIRVDGETFTPLANFPTGPPVFAPRSVLLTASDTDSPASGVTTTTFAGTAATAAVVPEPSSLAIGGLSCLAIGVARSRRKSGNVRRGA